MSKRSIGFISALILVSMLLVPAMANAQDQPPTTPPVYNNEVLGVQLISTIGLKLTEDEVLVNEEYGFTLSDKSRGERGLVLRVGMLYEASPDLDKAVADLVSRFPDIAFAAPEEVMVDGVKGVMLAGVPGIDPSVYIYVVVNGQLYQIIYGGEILDKRGLLLIDQLHFVKPAQTLDSLGLKRAEDTLYEPSPYTAGMLLKGPQLERSPDAAAPTVPQAFSAPNAVSACANWPTAQLMQTPISSTANGNGYSNAGPSYYGQNEHQYCDRTNGLNDYYALDFALRTGDVVYAPFTGTVKWIGWTCGGWSTLGKIVVVEKFVGATKYWSMAAHLNSTNVNVGDSVSVSTVIGYAGRSGNNNLTIGQHLTCTKAST